MMPTDVMIMLFIGNVRDVGVAFVSCVKGWGMRRTIVAPIVSFQVVGIIQ